MKQSLVLLTLMGFLLAACDGTPAPTIETAASVTLLAIETYGVGEPVAFTIADTVYVCEDELPYAIVQITESGERAVMLEHSCVGIEGAGIDQYCEDEQVKTVQVVFCSDAIFCEEEPMHQTVTWDQQEYVEITEECAGQTIHREIKQQVPEGKYQVRLRFWQDEQVEFMIIKEFMITADELDLDELSGATVEEAVVRFLELWAVTPYRDEQIEVLEEDGTRSKVRVVAQFRGRRDSDWFAREAVVGCRKREEGWLCDEYSLFQPLAPLDIQVSTVIQQIEYPADGQTVDYASDYSFKVEPIEGADGYLWGFFQDGEMVWENLRDEQQLSGNEYEILAGSEAHSKFVPGELEVSVRASADGQWTEAIVVTVYLR